MNCINPIYKLVEYLNSQVTSTTSDAEFRNLLQATLNTTANGYSIPKISNPNVCCPECPTDAYTVSTYFLGNIVNMIQFVSNYIAGNKQICCVNILGSDAAITQPGFSELVKLPICCNSFSKGYVDNLLLSMETWYDKDNPIHEEMCMNYPYNTIIFNGIVEYSLFNGDSAIYDL